MGSGASSKVKVQVVKLQVGVEGMNQMNKFEAPGNSTLEELRTKICKLTKAPPDAGIEFVAVEGGPSIDPDHKLTIDQVVAAHGTTLYVSSNKTREARGEPPRASTAKPDAGAGGAGAGGAGAGSDAADTNNGSQVFEVDDKVSFTIDDGPVSKWDTTYPTKQHGVFPGIILYDCGVEKSIGDDTSCIVRRTKWASLEPSVLRVGC